MMNSSEAKDSTKSADDVWHVQLPGGELRVLTLEQLDEGFQSGLVAADKPDFEFDADLSFRSKGRNGRRLAVLASVGFVAVVGVGATQGWFSKSDPGASAMAPAAAPSPTEAAPLPPSDSPAAAQPGI